MIHLVTLNPSIDTTIVVDHFGSRDCLAEKVEYFFAGKAINSAKALSFEDVEYRSYVFSGTIPMDGISLEGHEIFYHESVIRQNFSIYDHNGLIGHIRSRSEARFSAMQVFLDKIAVDVAKDDFLVIAGSVPSLSEVPRNRSLSRLLSKISCNLVIDSAAFGVLELEKLSLHTLKINSTELASVMEISNEEICEKVLVGFQTRLGCRVIVTQGKGRMLAVDKDGSYCEYELPDENVAKSLSKIGSGDVFLGGYLTSLSRGDGFSDSARLGMAYGALHQVKNLLSEAEIDTEYAGEIASSVLICTES